MERDVLMTRLGPDGTGEYAPDYLEPFRWLDAFEQEDRAEVWKERCYELMARRDEDERRMRQRYEMHVAQLERQLEGMMRHIGTLNLMQPIILKPPLTQP